MSPFLKSSIVTTLALAVTTAGCQDAAGPALEPVSSEVGRNLGAEIAAHPAYGELSERVTSDIAGIVDRASRLDAASAAAASAALNDCVASAWSSECDAIVAELGPSAADTRWARERARAIALSLELDDLDPAAVAAAFRHAQLITDGAGVDNRMLGSVLETADFECGAECVDSLGLALGTIKGNLLAGLANNSGGGDDDGGGDSSGGWIATTIVVVTAVYEVLVWIERTLWDAGEEDKECQSDDDCASNEYCHKIGVNDCRPTLPLDALCTRGGQCSSNCCKPHISAAFLPICRPADRCN